MERNRDGSATSLVHGRSASTANPGIGQPPAKAASSSPQRLPAARTWLGVSSLVDDRPAVDERPSDLAGAGAPAADDGRRRPRETRRTAWMRGYLRWLAVVDALMALVAGVAALVWTAASGAVSSSQVVAVALFPALWVATLALGRAYQPRFVGDGSDEFRRVVDSGIRLVAAVAVLSYITSWSYGRSGILLALGLATALTLGARGVGRLVLRRAEARGSASRRVIVVGTERATAELVRRLEKFTDHPFSVVGAIVDGPRSGSIEGVRVVGTSADILEAVARTDADTVAVAAWSTFSQTDLRALSWQLEDSDIELLVAPNLTDVSGPRISVRPVAGLPLLHVDKPEFSGFRRIFKSLFDRSVALLSLVLLSPLFLVLAIAVKVDSPGPVFFRQRRVGRNHDVFTMIKFRSMVVGAEDQLPALATENVHGDGPLFKLPEDPRVTRVGTFLRRTSLDELPQLWNVLIGHMSLVGPRPPLVSEVEQYEDHVKRRLLVKPGLTGLWQVSGRSDLSWEDSVRLDLYYVENWSFLFDITILVRTVRAVIASRGAY